MEQYFFDCYERFSNVHKEIKNSIAGLSVEALDWVPAGNTNSISVLVVHLLEAEEFWAVSVAGNQPSSRVRDEEFAVSELSEHDLVVKLDETLNEIQTAFESYSFNDLQQLRTPEERDMTVTMGWAILHALEHSALHLGHIQITVQLWEE